MVRAAVEEAEGPVELATLAVAEAEHARGAGEDDPALWGAAVREWQRLERPYQVALARWRQAQAQLARADREGATASLSESAAGAKRLGAHWLSGEIEGLAARARLNLRGPAEQPPDTAPPVEQETPFGLTRRELQVLELVASGATNREIGERLFMAEKTASVHVSRILTKLDVRGRTEAAAVAHRHGIGADLSPG